MSDMNTQYSSEIGLYGIMEDIYYDISLLYATSCSYTCNLVLNHLRDRVYMLNTVIKTIFQPAHIQPQLPPVRNAPIREPSISSWPTAPEGQMTYIPQPAATEGQMTYIPQPAVTEGQMTYIPQPAVTEGQMTYIPQPAVTESQMTYIPGSAVSESQMTYIPEPAVSEGKEIYTLQELSVYNGKGGNPAYIAVGGIVYDVTGNAAWAAATHFGLTAGRELTDEFISCHAGQPILSKLNAVGRLMRNE